MTHPYSIFIWQPPLSPGGEGHWNDAVHCPTQQWALYIANLMYQDSHGVIKVVRYGINLAYFPDAHAVELVEKQLARQGQRESQDFSEGLSRLHVIFTLVLRRLQSNIEAAKLNFYPQGLCSALFTEVTYTSSIVSE